ncbi:MAG: hypothetical protein ACOX9B_13680 [Candidatus Xenobium sp.]|jgi:hypothetical protein
MNIGIRFRQCLLTLALMMVLGLTAHAGLLPKNTYTYEGILGTINTPQITVVNERSGVVPIMLPQGRMLPADFQVGQRVRVELLKGPRGTWILRNIRKLDNMGSPSAL